MQLFSPLQRAKVHWDPSNMFSHQQSIRLPVDKEEEKEVGVEEVGVKEVGVKEVGVTEVGSSSDILRYDPTPTPTPQWYTY